MVAALFFAGLVSAGPVDGDRLYRRIRAVDDSGVEVWNQTVTMQRKGLEWLPADLTWVGTTRLTIESQKRERRRLLREPKLDSSRLPWPMQGDFIYWISDNLGRGRWGDLFERLDAAPVGQIIVFRPESPQGCTLSAQRVGNKTLDQIDVDGKYKYDVDLKTQSGSFTGQFNFRQGTHDLTSWHLIWHTDAYDRTPPLVLREAGSLYTPDAQGLPPP